MPRGVYEWQEETEDGIRNWHFAAEMTPLVPAKLSGRPEDCHEAEGGEVLRYCVTCTELPDVEITDYDDLVTRFGQKWMNIIDAELSTDAQRSCNDYDPQYN